MTGVPIDEDAFGKAFRAAHPTRSSTGVSEQRLRRGISAYLEAIGATVERAAATSISPASQRLVTPWKPFTDTEEER